MNRQNKQLQMLVVENFGACNMRCTYCFPEHMWKRQGRRGAMAEATYAGIVERAMASTSADAIDVHFAGGEPLLAGQEWLAMAFRLAREAAARHGKRVTFSMQTNATHATPELCRFLADNGVTVGVSLDGDAAINEAVRGHTDETLTGYQNLREAMGWPPGVIVTVTRCNAERMGEVIDYLDSLDVRLFRANQMGATAPWNAHAAPHAEEWATARRTIMTKVAELGGRMLEFNLVQSVRKLADTLLLGRQPFESSGACCSMRCAAGRQLLYFDQKGNAYPCPRANVTADALIEHFAAEDFEGRWDATIRQLDLAMRPPPTCARCPAQAVCDYGCHAFNVAGGNFFEVNCDATKDYFGWLIEHPELVARVLAYVRWRDALRSARGRDHLAQGVDLPPAYVAALTRELRERLAGWLSREDLDPGILSSRYGWREDLVPRPTANSTRLPLLVTEAAAEEVSTVTVAHPTGHRIAATEGS
jgi:uncharacterized protein